MMKALAFMANSIAYVQSTSYGSLILTNPLSKQGPRFKEVGAHSRILWEVPQAVASAEIMTSGPQTSKLKSRPRDGSRHCPRGSRRDLSSRLPGCPENLLNRLRIWGIIPFWGVVTGDFRDAQRTLEVN